MKDSDADDLNDLEPFVDMRMRSVSPAVSITAARSGAVTCTFNAAFYAGTKQDYFDKNKFIRVWFSKKSHTLVFEFTNNDAHAFKITRHESTHGTPSISLTSVVNKYDLDKNAIIGKYRPENRKIPKDKIHSVSCWAINLDKRL